MHFYLVYVFASLALAFGVQKWITYRRERQRLRDLAKHHGCVPAPQFQNQGPLGLSRIEQVARADAEGRLLDLIDLHFRQTGYTREKFILGFKSFDTADPENLEAMFSTNFKDWTFGPRRDITFPMFGDGIFTQEGSSWKRSRDILRPQFHFKQYADLGIFRASVDTLIDEIAKADAIIDLQPLFFYLTLDVTTAFLFGESVNSLKDSSSKEEETFAKAFNTAQEWIVKRFRLMDVYWLIGGRRFREACQKVNDFADRIIDRNLATAAQNGDSSKRYFFLRALVQESLDRTAIRGQIINILVAGRDTTACLLSWTFFLLVRHPAVLEKLRHEIMSCTMNVSELTRDDLRNMKYLQNVLKETLRLYPSVPINVRVAARDTVLPTGGGPDGESPVLIQKGTAVTYSIYSMHRRPKIFGMDAGTFRPERWDEEMPLTKNETWSHWAYLPFHGGPRTCLGMDFALTEAAYTVFRIIQTFQTIKLPEGTPLDLIGTETQRTTLVLTPAEGCKVEIR